jgi:Acetyl xylan esterase (AXE1)
MPRFDVPLEQLSEYRTETAEPRGFDSWWRLRLDQARARARLPKLTRYEADSCGPVEVQVRSSPARAATGSGRGTCGPRARTDRRASG